MLRRPGLEGAPHQQPDQKTVKPKRQEGSGGLGISVAEMDAKLDEVLFPETKEKAVRTGLASLRFGKFESEPEHTKVQIVRKGALALLDEAENTVPYLNKKASIQEGQTQHLKTSDFHRTKVKIQDQPNFEIRLDEELNVADRLKEEIRLLHDTILTTPHQEAKQEQRITRLAELELALKEVLQKECAHPVKQLEVTEPDPVVTGPVKTSRVAKKVRANNLDFLQQEDPNPPRKDLGIYAHPFGQKETATPALKINFTEASAAARALEQNERTRARIERLRKKQEVTNKALGKEIAKHFKNFTEQADVYAGPLSKDARHVINDPSPALQEIAREFGFDIEHFAENFEEWRKSGLADEEGHVITLQRLQKAQKASLIDRLFSTKKFYDSTDYYRKKIRNFIASQLEHEERIAHNRKTREAL